ncbi:MAG: orotidine-5'-phosphate decarboxylase [Phycisphaerae bacterium]|nr:orotidine-5'-phosphate decarboxylase [Phycisphaerae bacterium]
MAEHFADRLLAAIGRVGSPVCVGIDPAYDRLPDELKNGDEVAAIEAFGLGIIKAVARCVPAVKPQIAYFERYGSEGVAAYEKVVTAARKAGLIVIGDVKRNDIGSTAAAYAAGHLNAENTPDAITVNGYLGADGLMPFVDTAANVGKGVFVLVRTSNPSAATIQDFADANGKKFYEHIAEQVADIGSGEGLIGDSGYSCVGAVVGATYPDEARRLREIMPKQIFLVPGYGAQGASADDCAAAFKSDGTGAIVNASRSVIYAFSRDEYAGMDWKKAIETAAKKFADDIKQSTSRER